MLPEAVEIIVCEPAEVSKTAVQSNFRHCQLPTRIRAEHRAGLRQPVILQIIHRSGIAELLEAGMEPAAADPRHGDQVGKANRLVKVVVDILLDPPHNGRRRRSAAAIRSEEQTSELQSLMHISYAVFCLKKK